MYTAAVTLLLLIEVSVVALLATDFSQRAAFLCALLCALTNVLLLISYRSWQKLVRESEERRMRPCSKCQFPTMGRDPTTMGPLCLACINRPGRRAI